MIDPTKQNQGPTDKQINEAARFLGQRAFESIKKNGMPEGMAWDGFNFYWKTCETKYSDDYE